MLPGSISVVFYIVEALYKLKPRRTSFNLSNLSNLWTRLNNYQQTFATEHLKCLLLHLSYTFICFSLYRQFCFSLSCFWFEINVCQCSRAPLTFLKRCGAYVPRSGQINFIAPSFPGVQFYLHTRMSEDKNNKTNNNKQTKRKTKKKKKKTKRVGKIKVRVRLRINWKHCFFIFITEIRLVAFTFNLFASNVTCNEVFIASSS